MPLAKWLRRDPLVRAQQRLSFMKCTEHSLLQEHSPCRHIPCDLVIAIVAAIVAPISLEEEWAGLDLYQIHDCSERLGRKMLELGDQVRLADFNVVKLIGTGANGFAYVAQCRPDGQLKDHVDMLVVLKVMIHYRHPGGHAAELCDRAFAAEVEYDTRGPGFNYRHIVSSPRYLPRLCAQALQQLIASVPQQVPVLGSFMDDATSLPAYGELDSEFIDPRTAFVVLPFYCGGDLQGLIEKGNKLPEPLVLRILVQVIDTIGRLQKIRRAHRNLRPDNVFFCGDGESLAIAEFGEASDLQLEFTKGVTIPGGAHAYLAPEIMAQIESMADGETTRLDYAKNDIYAAGLIAYKMCLHDMDASPWPASSPPRAWRVDAISPIPADAYSERLRNIIQFGLLHPDPSQRMNYAAAQTEIMMMGYHATTQPPPAPPPEPAPELAPLWEWCEEGGQWRAYDAQDQVKLETAFRTGHAHRDYRSVNVDIGLGPHFVDVKRMSHASWDDPINSTWSVQRREVPEGVPPSGA